jgi:hypothetical protein
MSLSFMFTPESLGYSWYPRISLGGKFFNWWLWETGRGKISFPFSQLSPPVNLQSEHDYSSGLEISSQLSFYTIGRTSDGEMQNLNT